MSKGVDYAWNCPGGQALKEAGYEFACRYLSTNHSKNLSLNEVEDLHANGIKVVVVWETTEQRVLDGYDAGVQDARKAVSQASACGMPENRPIYFAADYDFSKSQQETINQYFKGVMSVMGGNQRVGIYGGLGPVSRCLDDGVVTWAWQTLAWSHGVKDPRIHIYQYQTSGHNVNGVDCDLNESMQEDYGQW